MNYRVNTAKHYGIKAMYDIEKIDAVKNAEKNAKSKKKTLPDPITAKELLESTECDDKIISYLKKRGFDKEDIDNAFRGIDEHLSAFDMI